MSALVLAPRGWLLLGIGEVVMLSTWLGASHLFIRGHSLGVVTLFGGAALCLIGPAFYGRGWRSAALGICAPLLGFVGFALVVNAVIALSP